MTISVAKLGSYGRKLSICGIQVRGRKGIPYTSRGEGGRMGGKGEGERGERVGGRGKGKKMGGEGMRERWNGIVERERCQ